MIYPPTVCVFGARILRCLQPLLNLNVLLQTPPKGGGLAEGVVPVTCEVCHGLGEVLRTVWSSSASKSIQIGACPACAGSGSQPQPPCMR